MKCLLRDKMCFFFHKYLSEKHLYYFYFISPLLAVYCSIIRDSILVNKGYLENTVELWKWMTH